MVDFVKKRIIDYLAYLLGGVLISISISCFAAPNDIAAGGFSGIATLLNYLFRVPIGISVLIMNIPIFIIGGRHFGGRFIIKSLIATVIMSIFIDLSSLFLPIYTGDSLLSAIFGGVLSGTGLAVIFVRGATTGGVDIIAKIINSRFPFFSMGRLILVLDAVVVIAAALVYRNIESGLYAVVMIFVQSKTIDWIVYGMDKGKVLLISSQNYREIAFEIMNKMHRGVTILQAKGAYTDKTMPMIMCAVRPFETSSLHKIVKSIDSHSFIITLEAGEIIGEGFREL